ncbi:MAG: hypothetical protein EF813_10125 [Methanosarcinales archaeon]|nr:MAG: hypothetical protein EF813_10125 [Methanosarcinales archaeon]
MVRLSEIEAEIEKAFKKTVKDYKNGDIKIEEDFRAHLHNHLKPFCDSRGLGMRLSRGVKLRNETVKPDILIYRGRRDFVVIEMKNKNSTLGGGNYDINKLKRYQQKYQKKCLRGYFIHIDKKDNRYKKHHRCKSPAAWKNNYFVDLWCVLDKYTIHKFEVKRGSGTEKIIR